MTQNPNNYYNAKNKLNLNMLVVYLAGVPTWPTPKLDLNEECMRIKSSLEELNKNALKDKSYSLNFEEHKLINSQEDAGKFYDFIINSGKKYHAVLMFNITSGVKGFDTIIDLADELEAPIIWMSQLFSGHDWTRYPSLLRLKVKVDLLASSDFNELIPRFDALYALYALRESRVLVIDIKRSEVTSVSSLYSRTKKYLGVDVVLEGPDRLNQLYEEIMNSPELKKEAEKQANIWTTNALKVVEPPNNEIIKAAALYLAMRKLMVEREANVITIACLKLFGINKLPAYPCLGFMELNNNGLLGVCEADIESSITQLIGMLLSGSPGFVSDPVFDVPKGLLIHAHCVAASKMAGPTKEAEKYTIRTHMEDDKGASVQVFMKKNEKISCLKYLYTGELLYSTGVIVDNIDSEKEPRGCRTKFATKVENIKKFLENYRDGLHRVVFYGDLIERLEILNRFLEEDAIKLIKEN
ncbi:MAG: hypothetical protein ACTSU2_05835 [Promethearchaeota archaeon]